MNKEEILRKSRQENKGQDERERDARAQAGKWAAGVGVTLCAVLNLLDVLFSNEVNYETWAIYAAIIGTMSIVSAIRLKKKSDMVCGMILLIVAVLFVISYLKQLVG